MNFLSHYYFDRKNSNSYEVLGSLLPDLLKNANKSWNIYPENKDENIFKSDAHKQLLKGWKKHLLVDKIFHNAPFFLDHQHRLKNEIKNQIIGSPVKPFFLGHIGVELILDNLLITKKGLDIDILYKHLDAVDDNVIADFFSLNDLEDFQYFFTFFKNFKKEKYLIKYKKPSAISYSLKRICMRVWDNPFTKEQEDSITDVVTEYISLMKDKFIIIFDDIESQITE